LHPEVWLRAQELDSDPLKHLVLCTLQQVREEVKRTVDEVGIEKTWARPFGLAPIGFHVRHIAESIDRLLTYLEGGALSPMQLAVLPLELKDEIDPSTLLALLEDKLRSAELRVQSADLAGTASIGRAAIQVPRATLLGHIAEHTQRHLGQIAVLRRLLPQV
jgi:uncharacterized damage-inducible protein DinB